MNSDANTHAGDDGRETAEIGKIAHDLNNQIMVIQGNASLMKTKSAEWPEMLDMAEQVLAASQRAADLIRQLQQISSAAV
ncbi:MAG: histidine kinase dimerization/phospho-acceptor domain-containing protein [Planctomycetota bacterium]